MAEKKKEASEKPLEKMTVKELREIAKEIPEIIGVHGMNKQELYDAIAKVRGIEAKPTKKTAKKKVDVSSRSVKQRIQSLKVERQNALKAKDKKMATIFKRRISRLKKKSRKAA